MAARDEYGMVEWLREHRVGLGPVYLGIPVLIAGLVSHFALSTVQTALGVIGLALAGYAISGGRPGGMERKVYYALITTSVCGWIFAAQRIPDTQQAWVWLLFALTVGGTFLALPWWTDQVKRTHVRMEHIQRSWPIRAERIRLSGTALVGMTKTGIGWSAKLSWLPGAHTVDEVLSRHDEIEGALGLQAGQLRMPKDGKSTNSVRIVVVTRDPHSHSLPWEIPYDEVNGQNVLRQPSVCDGFEFAVTEEGKRRRGKIFTKDWGSHHLLIGGTKGSGKSSLANTIWAWLGICRDVCQWGIDLKGGMELTPWRKAFDWIVTTDDAAVRMIECAEQIVNDRAAYCAKMGWKVWQPSRKHPVLVISVDEAASLLGDKATSALIERVSELARKGRAVGVTLIMATQYPTIDALGSTQIRAQIDQRFCFRMEDAKGEDYVITAGEVNAHKIDSERPGTCYYQDGDKLDRMPVRCLFTDDKTIRQVVDLVAGHTAPLDPFSASSAESVEGGGYADREIWVPGPRDSTETETDTESGGETATESEDPMANEDEPVEFESADVSLEELARRRHEGMTAEQRAATLAENTAALAEPERLDEAGAKAALDAALASAPGAGVGIEALCQATTRKRSWVYDRLMERIDAGHAVRTRSGLYASAAQVANSK